MIARVTFVIGNFASLTSESWMCGCHRVIKEMNPVESNGTTTTWDYLQNSLNDQTEVHQSQKEIGPV